MYELPKKIILRKFEFSKVYGRGRSYSNPSLIVHVLKSDDIKGSIGFAVGKKIGKAVIRNRIKRLMRETYRINRKDIKSNVSMILIARKTLIDSKFEEVNKAFKDICNRAKLWSKNQ